MHASSSTLTGRASPESPYWLENIPHQGHAPFHHHSESYPIFRNVKEYGAKGDGITDDTDAINLAISFGDRCGQGCESTTTSPALVYFPPGSYLISRPIIAYYYTQIIGDARRIPTLLASPLFDGIAVIDADPYIPGGSGAQWYTNQNNFFRSIRNLIVDLRGVLSPRPATGIHWQVSQATSLMNLQFEMSREPGNAHQGLFMENGSGGFMGDLVFRGGATAMLVGNQQFTVRNISVSNAEVAIGAIWNWGWTFQGVDIQNCSVGFDLKTGGSTAQNQSVGAEAIVDAIVKDTHTFIRTTTANRKTLAGSIILNNCKLINVSTAVGVTTGEVILSGNASIDTWVQGNVYGSSWGSGKYTQASFPSMHKPPSLLDNQGKIFGRMHPQYQSFAVDQFISVKNCGAKGDGSTDDTHAMQTALYQNAGKKIIYVPHGTYILKDTLEVPPDTRLVGEVWSVLAGSGPCFADPHNPRVVVRVGHKGSRGTVEISDIIFTTFGPAGGAIVVEWNIREEDGVQGSAAMFDSHIRLGGASGTLLEGDKCPKSNTSGTRDQRDCMAAFLGLHLTKDSSAYLEGSWVWLADHDLDLKPNAQINVFSGRGILSESQGPVWMIGTGSEHHVLYQYNLFNVRDHWVGLLQTESPYYQPTPPAPLPFSLRSEYHDPPVDGSAFGLSIRESQDVTIFGAGLYSFFSSYSQDSIPKRACQKHILDIDIHSLSNRVDLYSVSTVGLKYMVTISGKGIVKAKYNPNGFADTMTVFRL